MDIHSQNKGRLKLKSTQKSGCIASVVILVVLIVLIGMFGNNDGSTDKSQIPDSKTLSLSQAQTDLINSYIDQGYLKFDYSLNYAYVSPTIWLSIEFEAKQFLSTTIAIYYGNKNGTHPYRIEIYDKMSGKKLAEYSQDWGFEVY